MMIITTKKTPLENKHLHRCDYFAIIPHCLHSALLKKYMLELDW